MFPYLIEIPAIAPQNSFRYASQHLMSSASRLLPMVNRNLSFLRWVICWSRMKPHVVSWRKAAHSVLFFSKLLFDLFSMVLLLGFQLVKRDVPELWSELIPRPNLFGCDWTVEGNSYHFQEAVSPLIHGCFFVLGQMMPPFSSLLSFPSEGRCFDFSTTEIPFCDPRATKWHIWEAPLANREVDY